MQSNLWYWWNNTWAGVRLFQRLIQDGDVKLNYQQTEFFQSIFVKWLITWTSLCHSPIVRFKDQFSFFLINTWSNFFLSSVFLRPFLSTFCSHFSTSNIFLGKSSKYSTQQSSNFLKLRSFVKDAGIWECGVVVYLTFFFILCPSCQQSDSTVLWSIIVVAICSLEWY